MKKPTGRAPRVAATQLVAELNSGKTLRQVAELHGITHKSIQEQITRAGYTLVTTRIWVPNADLATPQIVVDTL